ncbi:MAG TPA: aldehyde dehydrogenase [Acidimicrobiales bacterium]|nr:aldehyde dehydrogenase [Acidimicrobiales bacterium]
MSEERTNVAGVAVATGHFINNVRVSSHATFEDRSPLDWSLKLADVARGTARDAAMAVGAAQDAFPAWAALSSRQRAKYLHRLADLIDDNVERIATVECLDMAMLVESLRLRVIARAARNFRAYADLAESYESRRWASNGTHNEVLRMPAGPTVVVTPWNAPFMLSTWKCAPALAAGNTVVLKPAEWSPLSCSLLMDLVLEAEFPPGVFNMVQGIGDEVGASLVADARVRRISFTGSPETGRRIGVAAAKNLVPFTAELGGKGPFVVFADADLDLATKKAASMYDDAGQVCLAGTRLIVEASVRDQFLERLTNLSEQHVLGDSRDPDTTISPLIHPEHFARVAGFVTRSLAAGDTLLFGGERLKDDGLWYTPTLIEPRDNNAEIVQREVFGPVLTLQTFESEAEAIELANSTKYGLTAMVFTSDQKKADRFGLGVRAGTIWVNCFLVRDLSAPFGGTGISGVGREGGDYALDFYSDLKTYQVKEDTTYG